jgi:hypothetical protein
MLKADALLSIPMSKAPSFRLCPPTGRLHRRPLTVAALNCMQVESSRPQEAYMLEAFAVAVTRRMTGAPSDADSAWLSHSALTQLVVCKVMESAKAGCVPVALAPARPAPVAAADPVP